MKPDDPLVRQVLAHSMVLRLATLSPRGAASVTPLWFVERHGRLFATTSAASVAARNATADPRVTVLIDGETAGRSSCVIRLAASATVHRGLPSAATMARLAAKYYLAPRGARCELAHVRQWRLRARYYAQSAAVVLEIEPTSAEVLRVPEMGGPDAHVG